MLISSSVKMGVTTNSTTRSKQYIMLPLEKPLKKPVFYGYIIDITGNCRYAFLILMGLVLTNLTPVSLLKPVRN